MSACLRLFVVPRRAPQDGEGAGGAAGDERLHYEPYEAEVDEGVAGEGDGRGPKRKISSWVERRATTVVSKLYKTQADDLEERARRAVSQAYEERADDLEERAVRAMRRAISEEAERFKEVIEHAVAVKKREVRLSLVVLIAAAFLYFLLDWFSKAPA